MIAFKTNDVFKDRQVQSDLRRDNFLNFVNIYSSFYMQTNLACTTKPLPNIKTFAIALLSQKFQINQYLSAVLSSLAHQLQQKYMKSQKTLTSFVFLSILLAQILTASAEVSINYVSGTLNGFTAATGSKGGGTVVYISGVNFSPNADDTKIYFWNYPCNLIAGGSTVSMLSCITTPMYDPDHQYSLTVTVYTVNLLPVTCTANVCRYSYYNDLTPIIHDIFPSTTVGNQLINVYGFHRIDDAGDGRSPSASDLRYILVGDTSCSTLDIIQDALQTYSQDSIFCNTFLHQQAGQFNLTERVVYGDAIFSIKNYKISFLTGLTYAVRIVPKFQNITIQLGGVNGHVLTFQGTGFENNAANLTSFTCRIGNFECSVISNPQGSITLKLPPYDASYHSQTLIQDLSDSTTQQNPFLGSHGFRYTRFSSLNNKGLDTILFDFRAGNSSEQILYDGYQTQLSSLKNSVTNYDDYLRGYFYAPVDGSYTFEATVDDIIVVYISKVQNTSNPDYMEVLIRQDNYMIYQNDPYNFITTTNVAWKTLTAGYYYMEIVSRDNGGDNYYYVSVSMPPIPFTFPNDVPTALNLTNKTLPNPTWKMENIIITPTNINPQIITVTVDTTQFANSSATYKLYYFGSNYNQIKSSSISIKATASQFKSALGSLAHFKDNGLVVTLTMYDSAHNVVNSSSSATLLIYQLTYQWTRPSSYTKLPYCSVSSGVTIATTQTHSPSMSGTYMFKINGAALNVYDNALGSSSTSIQVTNDLYYLKVAMQTYYNAPELDIYPRNTRQMPDQLDFDILYLGVADPQPITIDVSGLTGGTDNAFTLTITTKRDYSASRPYFKAIPYEFLRMASPKPTIQIAYNKMPAICMDCFYQYQTTEPISVSNSQFTDNLYSGLDITLTSTDSSIFSNYSLSDITVTLLQSPCVVSASSTTSHIICNFNTITCGGNTYPQLNSGSDYPRVHIKQIGFLPASTPLDVDPIISSISPTQVGANGGVTITVNGKGFPYSSSGPKITIIPTNGNIAGTFTIKPVSFCQFQFSFPAVDPSLGDLDTTLSYRWVYSDQGSKTFSDSTSFTLKPSLDPSVTALSIQSASPILKQNIIVTGANFDINPSNMKVFLYFASNLTKKYELGILSVTDTTSMTCVLGGGRTEDYYLLVMVAGKGMSAPSNSSRLSYEIVVDSVSPTTGSIGGGYTMTINGANFATAQGSTQVFIGDGLNSLCPITSITTTTITCTVPPIDSTYKVGDIKTVLVTGRLIENSRCKGTCGFTYQKDDTIYVQLQGSSTLNSGDTVTITTNTTFDTANTVVTVGSQSVSLLSITTISLSFIYPSLSAGSYSITVKVNGVNAYPLLQTTTELSISSISSNAGSNEGQILWVTGNGFGSIKDPSNVVYFNCSSAAILLPLLSITPTNATFQVPSNPNMTCQINVTMGLTFKVWNYAQSAGNTPFITVTSLGSNNWGVYMSNTKSKAIKFIIARYLDADGGITTSSYVMSWTSVNSSYCSVTPSDGYLPAGTFLLQVSFEVIGFADSTTNQITIDPTQISALSPSSVTVSFGGQGSYTLSAAGFITNNIQNNDITVCGIRAKILSASKTAITLEIPPFVNAQTHTTYGLGTEDILNSQAIIISDTVVKTNYAFDNNTKTFYSSINQVCFIGLDFGANAQGQISKIRYMPNAAWIRLDRFFDGAVFQGSNDNSSWTTIFSLDPQLVHTGWNVWLDSSGGTVVYRYVRFRQSNGTSRCQLAELEFSGIVFSTTPFSSSLSCPLSVNLLGASQAFSNVITYSDASTSVINSIDPSFGPSTGGTLLTITGRNFATSAGSVSFVIDGITCVIVSQSSSQIQCTTGLRVTPPAGGNSFVAISDGNSIILTCSPFLYIDRWSSTATWGGEVPPREGDTVYVPPGMTLLVDQSTPYLNTIIVQGGKIIFSDQSDMTVDANYFILIGGEFRAGLPSSPYQHKLTITLHGGYYDKQLPYFGNKVLGCMNCKFNMHGIVRSPTWTQITKTVSPGDNTLTLLDAVDWVAGESIAIAATGFNHFESEQRTIVSVSADRKVLTVDTPFVYRHFSGTERYAGVDFVMNAEVGLLTRNIVIQGDEMSDVYNHGSHLIFMGSVAKGLQATLSYTEIRYCGQPKIIARYCSHFHMAGEVPDSFVRGIAVHHSHARVLTIHGTHYLTVQKNVGYLVQGHNIFVQDGIETHNIIQDNLMISTIASQTLLQSDTSPASYWITNPLNTVINNHAAGGDFYGFWYEIKPNPDGPSATPNICPTGMRLGRSSNNVAHSNRKFGLRIFDYAARQYPCLPLADESEVNPFDSNPAIQSVFDNYLLWKNHENGVLGEHLGFVTLSKFLIIDSGASGMQFYATNVSLQNVTAKQSIIVGFSTGNAPSDMSTLNNVRGIITPRTDGFRADDITFVNFSPLMTPLQSCSKCQSILFQVTGGKTSFFNKITFTNIQGNYIYWNHWRREIFIDEDGSLTTPITNALSLPQGNFGTITPYFDHLSIPGHCYNIVNLWDNSTYCDSKITIRSLLYTNFDPSSDFVGQTARTFRLNSLTDSDDSPTYDVQPMIIIKKSHDIPGSFAFPYAVNNSYHTHFQYGIDFTHLSLAPGPYWLNNEGIIIKFNYTDQRQLYQIGHYYAQKLQTPLINQTNGTMLDPTTCLNGDYINDQVTKHLYVCVTGRNKQLREWIDITGVKCLNFCPKSSPLGDRESFTRIWSNVTQWPNQTLPKAGDNVTIPYEWNLVLDMSPPALNYVLVNGALFFDAQDLTFQANTIWVQQGGIYIGSADKPFTNQAKIILNGNKEDNFTVIDPEASGNKMLAVTGALQFYGVSPNVTKTRLTAIAPANTNIITVQELTGWKVGDEIVIGSTYSGQGEDEVFKIASITGNTISLNASLQYEHYGDANPLTNSKGGKIDMRAVVGLLTRNIKITRGQDPNNWGCRVQVYSYIMQFSDPSQSPMPVNGYIVFDGVQMDGCGQYGSSNAGIRIQKIGSMMNTSNPTVIVRSTIRNCNGYCVYIDNASNVTFDNNIIHFGRRFLVFVLKVTNYAFINNALIGLRIRPEVVAQGQGTGLVPNNAAYEQYVPVNSDTDNVTVTNNIVQGSQDNGFVLPFTPCSKIGEYPFKGNTAGSCFVAFALNVIPGFQCIAASGFSGYASYIGFIANPPGILTRVEYTEMFFLDNQRAFTLRFAHEIDDNTILLNNSYFMGYSRPSCPSCYSTSKLSYCNDGYAIRMFTATISGEQMPFNKNMTSYDVICTQQAFDMKAFLFNVTFQNYKAGTNSIVPYCINMNIFRKHDLASDATGVHNLYNSTCINCDFDALVYFSPASPDTAGWSGGCGELDCTGAINYFIHDHDGKFTATFNSNNLVPTQLLANNQPIGGNQTACQRVQAWNGYWCKFQELAVLEYQSIAADFNKRMVWPITLGYDGGLWNSTTNAWKEWGWIAPGDPAETRLARFWSVVRLKKYYTMIYASQPPSDAVYQIQKRLLPTGNPDDWVIIRIYFPIPNTVIVKVTNTTGSNIVVPGYQQINGTYQDLNLVTNICGANYYKFQTNSVHFVVNGKANCQVRLTLSSYAQITIRFQIDMSSFYSNNGATSILTNIIAFLNIDPSQIKIVGINPGSTILTIHLLPPSINDPVSGNTNSTVNSTDNSTAVNASDIFNDFVVSSQRNPVKDSNDLTSLLNKLTTALTTDTLDLNYTITNLSSTMKIITTNNTLATVCPPTFLYNITSNICYCDTDYVEIDGACVSCQAVANSTGKSDPDNSLQCQCQSTFIWADGQKKCLCPTLLYIIDANGECFNCATLSNGTGLPSKTAGVCECKPSFVFFTDNNTCGCPDPVSYISNNTCYGCSKYSNGTGKVASGSLSCECLPSFVIDKTVDKCTCLASQNLLWNSTTSSCVCKSGYALNVSQCVLCSSLALSTSASVAGVSCVCQASFVWNPSTISCGCTSKSILAQVNGTQTCIICDGKIGASGVDALNSSKCQCKGGLVWNSLKKLCECSLSTSSLIMAPNATCIPCTTATDSNIIGTPLDGYNCRCADPFFWDNIQMKCVSCNTLPNSRGKEKGFELSCICMAGFYFDAFTNLCRRVAKTFCFASDLSSCMDCSLIPYADLGTGPVSLNVLATGTTKNQEIIGKHYAPLQVALGRFKGYQCSCDSGYYWEPKRVRCFSALT